MMHFNPLNIVNLGGNKVQHPEAARSNTISRNVEAAYKDFTDFQFKLKNLVMLYKTRHQLIDSLNENGLYTARCYDEIFHDTPLSLILAPRVNSPASPHSPTSPSEDESEFVANQTSLRGGKIDEIDTTEYPDTGLTRKKKDADEGSMILKDLSTFAKEPEGIRASLYTSMAASETASVVARDTVESQNTPRRRERSDPPSRAFPDDEIDAIFEKNPRNVMHAQTQMEPRELGDNVNFIVDDGEDSFMNEHENEHECEAIDDSKEDEVGNRDDQLNENNTVETINADKKTMISEPVQNKMVSSDEQEQEMVSFRLISANTLTDDTSSRDVNTPSREIPSSNEKKSYERIKHDSTPTPQSKSPPLDRFYFDIHKGAYKETLSKLTEHSDIVAYVEKWESTITKRVQSDYAFYCKDRTSLNHYAKKLDSLIEEDMKAKEKNRPVKGKQMDKLERNQVKFESAQETHDNAGESLLLLMEEVTLRSWRDAFPLLRKSIQFEGDFAAINQKHMAHLDRSLDLLDIIGQKESISLVGRLEDFEKLDPRKFYTGSKEKYDDEHDDD